MSSTKKSSRMHGFKSAVAALLPLAFAAAAHAGETAREATSSAPSHVSMEAGDALGLEVFARELQQSDTAARAPRPEIPSPPADRQVAGEPVPAAPDLSGPASH